MVALRNLETANNMYSGNIQCEPNKYSCLTRRKIGMHKYRSVLDAFATLQATTQDVCIMEGPATPVDVLMANSEADRDLEDPKGWISSGYMTSSHRLSSGSNNIGAYYIQTQKKNMGKRTPRAAYGIAPTIIRTLFPGITPSIIRTLIPGIAPLFPLED